MAVPRSFSTLWTRGKKHFSEVFYVGGCPWRLSLYPKCVPASCGSTPFANPAGRRPSLGEPTRRIIGCPHSLTLLVASLAYRGNTAVKGSRDHVAIYLESADSAAAPVGWKRFVDFRLGVVQQPVRPARKAASRAGRPSNGLPDSPHSLPLRTQPLDAGVDKSIWRSGSHEFNSETSDGTWGFSQARAPPPRVPTRAPSRVSPSSSSRSPACKPHQACLWTTL